VPPHVFELSDTRLRYARFEDTKGSLEGRFYREVELPAELFLAGPLGGQMRDTEAFDRCLRDLLAETDAPFESASLMLPDRWLRTILVELLDQRGGLEEMLRWRLKKLVPFLVDDLRVRGIEAYQPEATGTSKILVGFAIEQLLEELETAFSRCGIRLGQITNRSLGIVSALSQQSDLRGVALVEDGSYSLVFVQGREALMMRFKALQLVESSNGLEELVRRDLRVTRGFLEKEYPGFRLSRSLFCGPKEDETIWLSLLEEGLGAPSQTLGEGDLRPTSSPLAEPWSVISPLMGVAGMEAT